MGFRRNFSRGGNVDILLIIFKFCDVVQKDLHKTLYHFHTTKKMTQVTVTVTKNVLRWQQTRDPGVLR